MNKSHTANMCLFWHTTPQPSNACYIKLHYSRFNLEGADPGLTAKLIDGLPALRSF